MEVSAIMALPAQLSQAVNGTAGADEPGNPQSGSPLSARFSRLLEQRAGMGEDARASSEPSANAKFLKVIAAPMQQQAAEIVSGQGAEAGPETTALQEQDEEPGDRSPGGEIQETPAYPVLTDLPWSQPVVAANPVIALTTADLLPEMLAMQSSRKDETEISAICGNAQAGSVAGGQSVELPAQNRQQLSLKPVNANGEEKQEATTPVQSATLPLQDGTATAITETEPSGMQPAISGKTAKGAGVLNNAVNATSDNSELSVFIQESSSPRNAAFSTERSSYQQIPPGAGANPNAVAEPRDKGMKQAANVTMPQAEVVSPKFNGNPLQPAKGQNANISALGSQETGNPMQEPATVAEIPITGDIRMGAKEVANGMQPAISGKTTKGAGVLNNAVNATSDNSELSVFIQESSSPRNAAFSTERSSYQQIPPGAGANPDVGAEPRIKGMKQAANVTVPQAEVVSPKLDVIPLQLAKGQNTDISASGSQESGNPLQEPATVAEIPVTVQIRMGGKEVANAYMASAGEAASNFSGIASSIISGIRTAKQGLKDEGQSIKSNLYVADPALKPELNIMDPSGKPGLNSADPVQAQKQVEIAFTGETQFSVMEAGGEVPGTVREDKSAGTDNSGLVLLSPGETRINGDSRLSTPVTDGKQAFSEQIRHQVREKLESGDYGLNKGNITLKLHPEELGEIKINLRMEDQRLKVEIVTENRSVKEALMQNIDTLKETLSRQNITMDRFNVSADIRQGFQQGSRDGSRMMQENRGANTPFDSAVAVDENTLSKVNYGWESDNSLVSLIL